MPGKRRLLLLVLAAALAWTGGLLLAHSRRAEVEVITLRPDQVPSFHPRVSGSATITLGSRCIDGAVAPDPTWTCVNSVWTATAATPMGGVGPGRAAGCVTVPPANQYTCINGVWMAPGTTSGGSTTLPGGTTPPPGGTSVTPPPPTPQCLGTPPITGAGQTVGCDNGVWVIR
ncbi:MAG TPA: hypothetical protein VFV98_17460 [Vicinamibacterales bacterium]|nr:hypothetical protein [Vicinamibacterales bacterium]